MTNNILQIVSYNCQGLNSAEKRRDVFNYLKTKNCNIYCLQDTHFTEKDEPMIKNLWGGDCIFNSFLLTKEELRFYSIKILNSN